MNHFSGKCHVHPARSCFHIVDLISLLLRLYFIGKDELVDKGIIHFS
jgi:hypothetical protein